MHRHLRSGPLARLLAVALLLASVAVPAIADTVYVVSRTTGGLYRFESADPQGTMSGPLATFSTPEAMALGPDGNLYVGESGESFGAPRIMRYTIATGSTSEVVSLGGVAPGAIAFLPGPTGGMLVGRNPFTGAVGPVLRVTDWNTGSPSVNPYTTGTALDATSSPGLAVASDGTLYVSSSFYDGSVISGTVIEFDPSGVFQRQVASTATPQTYGPAGLVLDGNTLYSASVEDGKLYRTTLAEPTTTLFGSTPSAYGAAPLARLSNGEFLTGSVDGFSGAIYRFGAAGTLLGAITNPTAPFGQVSGIVTVPVPEPATMLLAATGVIGIAWRLRGRRAIRRN
jgi:sugar lactone lactonase YvrE